MELTKKEKDYNLTLGLGALVIVIVLVALIGIFSLKPDPYIIAGEAEATEYRVSSKVPSRVASFLYEEGDYVQKGDTVVIMDSPEVRAKMAQAKGAKHAAEAQNAKAINGAREELIAGAYEMWQKALVGERIMQQSWERVSRLYEKGVVTAQKRDEVQAQYDAAVATARAAKTQYDMALNGAQAEDKAAAAALVERANGALQEVNGYMNELYLTAPCNGEVTERFPKVGELVGSGSPILSIIDLNDAWFTFAIREDYLENITVGDELLVTIPALGKQLHRAHITHIQVMGSYATWRNTNANGGYDVRTFNVKARPNDLIPNLRPGMSVIVKEVKHQ